MPHKPKDWITQQVAANVLGTGLPAVRKLVASGRLTSRHVPGSRVRVLLSEVETLARESTRMATAS